MFGVKRQIGFYQCEYATFLLYSVVVMLCFSAKDDRIKIWKCSNEAGELSVSSTLEFQSQEKEPLPSESLNVTDVPTPVPSSVLPYIAIDVSIISSSNRPRGGCWTVLYLLE